MRKCLFVLLLVGSVVDAQTVTVTGDGAATVVTVGTQGPAGAGLTDVSGTAWALDRRLNVTVPTAPEIALDISTLSPARSNFRVGYYGGAFFGDYIAVWPSGVWPTTSGPDLGAISGDAMITAASDLSPTSSTYKSVNGFDGNWHDHFRAYRWVSGSLGPSFSATLVYAIGEAGDEEGSKTKDLTESSATNVIQLDFPAGGHFGGEIIYDLYCADATDFVSRFCSFKLACVNKAGTETCQYTAPSCTPDSASSGGSFSANTVSLDNSPVNGIIVQMTATCSLTQTTLQIHSRGNYTDNVTVTPQ